MDDVSHIPPSKICIRMSQIHPNLCFKIVLEEFSDSEIFASRERLFHSEAPYN